MNIYVDVRGPQPMLIIGMCVTEMLGAERDITVPQAKYLVELSNFIHSVNSDSEGKTS